MEVVNIDTKINFRDQLTNKSNSNDITFIRNSLYQKSSLLQVNNPSTFFKYIRDVKIADKHDSDVNIDQVFNNYNTKYNNRNINCCYISLSDYHEVIRKGVKTRLFIDFDSKFILNEVKSKDEDSDLSECDKSEDEDEEDEDEDEDNEEDIEDEEDNEDDEDKVIKDKIEYTKDSYLLLISYIIKYLEEFKDTKNCKVDKSLFSKYIICDSIRKCNINGAEYIKVSQHVIFPYVIFDDIDSMDKFMEKVKSKYISDNNIVHNEKCQDIIKCMCSDKFNYIDLNVYKAVNFRIPLSCSRGVVDRDKLDNKLKLNENYTNVDYETIDKHLIERSTETVNMVLQLYQNCNNDIHIDMLDDKERVLQTSIPKRNKNYMYTGTKTFYFVSDKKDNLKIAINAIEKSNYILNVSTVMNIKNNDGTSLTPDHFNKLDMVNGAFIKMGKVESSMLLLQLIPEFQKQNLQIYHYMINNTETSYKPDAFLNRDEYLKDKIAKLNQSFQDSVEKQKLKSNINDNKQKQHQSNDSIPISDKNKIDKINSIGAKNDTNLKPYKLLKKYTNIKTINRCLTFIATNLPQYYTEYKSWSQIGLCLGHLYRYYIFVNEIQKSNEIFTEYNNFSMNSKTNYAGVKSITDELLKSTTSLTHYDGKLKINSLFNILKKITINGKNIGEEEYNKLFPKKQILETFDEFRNKVFNSEKHFTEEINKCVTLTPTSHIIKLFKSSSESEYKYSYVQTPISDAMKQYNAHNVFIKQKSTEDGEIKNKKYKLGVAITQFCSSQVSSLIFNPQLPFGIQQDIEFNKPIFNIFRNIPVTEVQLKEDDNDIIIVNKFLEDLCGKELNPTSYREYYDYVLNYLSWIFANKKSSGVMLLFAGSQGSGKTLMSDFIKSIFTHEYSINSSNDTFFNNKFNSQIVGKLIVTIDEFKVESLDKYKNTIESKDMIEITTKGKNTVSMKTYHNYIATSNTLDQKLDSEDRRTCVINSGYKINKDYASKVLVPILKSKSTINKFRNILIQRWENIKNSFNVSMFPISELKVQMTQNNLSDFNSYLIKEYYYIKSKKNILFTDFKENYCIYVDDINNNENKTTITDKSFYKLYSNIGINKKRIRINGTLKYIIDINNIDKMYERLIDKSILEKTCIELNDNNTLTDPDLYDKFINEVVIGKDEEEDNLKTEDKKEHIEDNIPLLDKLLNSKSHKLENKSLIELMIEVQDKISKEDLKIMGDIILKYIKK